MMLIQFFVAFISIIGFAILFNIPKNALFKTAFAGAMGWITFIVFQNQFDSTVLASFMGACVVAAISEIFARAFKETVTVFVIPGILPLVPGAGMYYTMLAILQKDFSKSALVGTETLFIAGSISAGILVISSFTRIIVQLGNLKKNKAI